MITERWKLHEIQYNPIRTKLFNVSQFTI